MRQTDPLRTEQEVDRFLNFMARWSGVYFVGCVIGMNWGLRSSDILALRVGDVLAGSGKRIQIADRIQIREQKTGHLRDIPITDKMKEILSLHIRNLKQLPDYSPDMPLVLSQKRDGTGARKALCRRQFWFVIKRAADALGLNRRERRIGTHSLRKTYAYQAWRSGVRVDVLQREFGHADVATTHRYACIPDERLDQIFDRVNFGNKDALARRSDFRLKREKRPER